MKNKLSSVWQSSQFMSKQDYEVNLYSDRYFKTVEMHSHDFFEIYCFIRGSVDYIVENGKYHLVPGDILLIPPNFLHQPNIKDPTKTYDRIVLWLSAKYVKRISSEKTDLSTCFEMASKKGAYLVNNNALSEVVKKELLELINCSTTPSFGSDIIAENHIKNVLAYLGNYYILAPQSRPAQQGKLVSEAIKFINENLSSPLSLDILAEKLFASKYHVAHLFKEEIGISPHSYIIKKRLLLAKKLIENGQPITEVYQRCGFADYTHFFRSFKNEFGLTPKQYFHLIMG